MKITFTISQLEGGGAERVMVLLAQGLLERDHEITVITLSSAATDFYRLPSTVHRVGLDLKYKSPTVLHGIFNTVFRLIQLRKAIRRSQPDIVITFMASMNIFTTLALLKTRYPVIGTQHGSPKLLPIGQPWELLRKPTYRQLQKLVSVSQGVDGELTWLPQDKRAVIYNPILPIPHMPPLSQVPLGADPSKKWVIAMGRLTAAKGFDLLLMAFHQIADQYPDWQLLILGEGELRSELESLRDRLNLSQSVIFTGQINDPFALLQQSQLFVMSSRTEGFPMALGEALACGLPAIATDCSQGIRELMRDGVDGMVIPSQDVTALAHAMGDLMSDPVKRETFARKATEVVERFGLEQILDQWEKLISRVLKEQD